MKQYNVAVLGATGAVGREMLKILEERNFPVAALRPLASSRSAGSTIDFKGKPVMVQEACKSAFAGMDIVLGAAENEIAKKYAPAIKAAGAVFVDNSSAFRMEKDVPLVIPEINPEDVKWHHGIISNPNCTTIVTLVAINALAKLSPIKAMVASSYQAVSGAGAGGPMELMQEVQDLSRGGKVDPKVFQYQIAYNVIPQIGGFGENGYTSEEMKMQNEGRKILHLPELLVTCTCVRVPVVRSHSVSVTVVTERPVSVEEAQAAIAAAPGCRLVDDPANKRYPMPLETSDQDIVFVGRIRRDLTNPNGLALWCCGDQVRKGAATNTVQIAELLLER
ncbi:MAG: aspartate-semialdehyde dehydrogenase [Clostridia bacterium]|nr:aspartate-semialdehyde dehydrogenase [Candidatus Pelethousia sp.]NCB31480.1 aspartate-semialdehyde dehydrogenase [Clostridia bacterium]